jgi:heme O synthase-like polyprenyltransferase
VRLVRKPERSVAWRAFAASIVQLGTLMLAAILDRLLLA